MAVRAKVSTLSHHDSVNPRRKLPSSFGPRTISTNFASSVSIQTGRAISREACSWLRASASNDQLKSSFSKEMATKTPTFDDGDRLEDNLCDLQAELEGLRNKLKSHMVEAVDTTLEHVELYQEINEKWMRAIEQVVGQSTVFNAKVATIRQQIRDELPPVADRVANIKSLVDQLEQLV